jgi:hypothetical protein
MLAEKYEGILYKLYTTFDGIILQAIPQPMYSFTWSSSASVVDVLTVFCLEGCHIIGPLNSLIRYR